MVAIGKTLLVIIVSAIIGTPIQMAVQWGIGHTIEDRHLRDQVSAGAWLISLAVIGVLAVIFSLRRSTPTTAAQPSHMDTARGTRAEALAAELASIRDVATENARLLEPIVGPRPEREMPASRTSDEEILLDDDSVPGVMRPGETHPPQWRLRLSKHGEPMKLAVYIQERTGTDHREEGYFPKWRLHEDRYVSIGAIPQTIDIAQVTNDMNHLIRAGVQQAVNPRANALDFFSPSVKPDGFFTRQVTLDGSLRMRIVVQDENTRVHMERTFTPLLDAMGPRMAVATSPQ